MTDGNNAELTATESALLGALALRGELSGYDLSKFVESSVGYFWGPAKSQIYSVLPRLVDRGLATRREVRQSQRPDKQLYRITAEGEEAVRSWLGEPVVPEPQRSVFLLKLFFGGFLAPDTLLEHVRRQRREAEQLQAELNAIDERLAGKGDLHPALTRRYGRALAGAVIGWADETELELEAEATDRGARA